MVVPGVKLSSSRSSEILSRHSLSLHYVVTSADEETCTQPRFEERVRESLFKAFGTT
jgi:hypothetical protein